MANGEPNAFQSQNKMVLSLCVGKLSQVYTTLDLYQQFREHKKILCTCKM